MLFAAVPHGTAVPHICLDTAPLKLVPQTSLASPRRPGRTADDEFGRDYRWWLRRLTIEQAKDRRRRGLPQRKARLPYGSQRWGQHTRDWDVGEANYR